MALHRRVGLTAGRMVAVLAFALTLGGCWGASNSRFDARVAMRGNQPDGSDLQFIFHLCPGDTVEAISVIERGTSIVSSDDDRLFSLPDGRLTPDTWHPAGLPVGVLPAKLDLELIVIVRLSDGTIMDLGVASGLPGHVGEIVSGGEYFGYGETAAFLAAAERTCPSLAS